MDGLGFVVKDVVLPLSCELVQGLLEFYDSIFEFIRLCGEGFLFLFQFVLRVQEFQEFESDFIEEIA